MAGGTDLDGGTERAVSYALRSSSRLVDARAMHAYKLSISKALKMHKTAAKEAIGSELQQLLDKRVWDYVDEAKLSITQRKKIIRSLMFLKEKF